MSQPFQAQRRKPLLRRAVMIAAGLSAGPVLVALVSIGGMGRGRIEHPAELHVTAGPNATGATAAGALKLADPDPSTSPPACPSLQLLDIQLRPDGSVEGAWLATETRGVRLVAEGDSIEAGKLDRILLGDDAEPAKAWLRTATGTCVVSAADGVKRTFVAQVQVRQDAGRASSASGETARRLAGLAQPPGRVARMVRTTRQPPTLEASRLPRLRRLVALFSNGGGS